MAQTKITNVPAIKWDDPREQAVFKIFSEYISPGLTGGNVTVEQIVKGIVKIVDACNADRK